MFTMFYIYPLISFPYAEDILHTGKENETKICESFKQVISSMAKGTLEM